MNSTRHEPISQYRVVIRHKHKGDLKLTEVLYCESRDEAIALAAKTDGQAESFVYGIGYQPIEKVLP